METLIKILILMALATFIATCLTHIDNQKRSREDFQRYANRMAEAVEQAQ